MNKHIDIFSRLIILLLISVLAAVNFGCGTFAPLTEENVAKGKFFNPYFAFFDYDSPVENQCIVINLTDSSYIYSVNGEDALNYKYKRASSMVIGYSPNDFIIMPPGEYEFDLSRIDADLKAGCYYGIFDTVTGYNLKQDNQNANRCFIVDMEDYTQVVISPMVGRYELIPVSSVIQGIDAALEKAMRVK